MQVLYMYWESFGSSDIEQEFQRRGFKIHKIPFKIELKMNQEISEELVHHIAKERYDFVFSFNYYPVISLACNACQVKYISWVYDSPLITLYSNSICFPYNYVFVFDKQTCMELQEKGVSTVYYLPLAAAVERYDSYEQEPEVDKIYKAPISFIGETKENYEYNRIYEALDNYEKGYLDAIIEAQKNIYGEFILEESMSPEIMKKLDMSMPENSFATKEWMFAHYYLAREVTARERCEVLEYLSRQYDVNLYSSAKSFRLPRIVYRGCAGAERETAIIYRNSKINLNITLRSILSGIPLRAFDIMGSCGFLLTNFQADFLDCFIPGEDYVYYESYDDLMEKAEYYLSHEKERSEIALSGYEKIKKNHTYKERVDRMLEIVFDS